MSDDKIAQALNMRSLQDINDEKQELLDEANPDKLPDLPVNAFSTNEEVDNLPIEAPVQHPVVIDDAGAEENLKDIELAKANIENIISLGDDSIKEMVEIAKQSESPRAFEVVSTLMKTLLDANKDYVEMSTKKRYAKEEANPAKNEVTNNNLIVSTADLLKMIKGESE